LLILAYSIKLEKGKERKRNTSLSHSDMTSHRFVIITADLRFTFDLHILKYLKDLLC